MGRVDSKVVMVTGAASGLGAASARMLVEEGATVVLLDINAEAGEALAKELGERASFLKLDVSSEQEWIDCVARVLDDYGRLDVLVNNAGIVITATIEDTSYEQLKRVQSINEDGPFLGCKHAIPAMAKNGGGAIVNISSIASMVGTAAFAAYSCSKGAVRALTQTVAVHCKLRGNGVRCNSVHPGAMDTPMTQNLAPTGASPIALEMMAETGSASRGEPADVAALVVYLASDESRFVNGAQMVVDDALTVGA